MKGNAKIQLEGRAFERSSLQKHKLDKIHLDLDKYITVNFHRYKEVS